MGRRLYSAVLAVLLCVAFVSAVVAVELMPRVSGWVDVLLVAGAIVAMAIPGYLIARPPDFRDDGDGDNDTGGGGKEPPVMPPDRSPPSDGLPHLDWSSFDDLRRDWERDRVGS